jgi:hypothetical protein
MSKANRAAGTAGHFLFSVPFHIIMVIVTGGLWIPVWIVMSIRRRNRRHMEAIAEEEVRLSRRSKQPRMPSQSTWTGIDPYGPAVP